MDRGIALNDPPKDGITALQFAGDRAGSASSELLAASWDGVCEWCHHSKRMNRTCE